MKIDWIAQVQAVAPEFFPSLAAVNHSTDHNNPHHQEANSNLLGHVLSVYMQACTRYPEDSILQLAALLHDIGKPLCQEFKADTARTSFHSHESLGCFLAIDILNKLAIQYSDKIKVIELIARHGDHWKLSAQTFSNRYDQISTDNLRGIAICDTLGSIKLGPNSSLFGEDFTTQLNIYSPQVKTYTESCTLLIGPPCSGKSTYLSENYPKTPVISRDKLVHIFGHSDNYNEAWTKADQTKVDEALTAQIKAYSAEQEHFIVDMTNMTTKTRAKFTQLKRSVNAIVFLPSLPTLLQRNQERAHTLDPSIILNMCKRFQPPYPGENFSTINYIFN